MTSEPAAVFVYGTLQRGEVRERCWPRPPISIESATVRGTLYDLGPYPALGAGDDIVAGELWCIAPSDMVATLAALDRVEGFSGSNDDLYRRLIVDCQTAAGSTSAWTYHLANVSLLRTATRILPGVDGRCYWKRHSTP